MFEQIHQSLEHWASVSPQKIAFESPKVSFSYRKANHIANQLAVQLMANGLKKGDKVGILMSRTAYSPLAVYAVLKAGGVYVPIDPESPTERIQFIIHECEIQHFISEQMHSNKIKNIGIPSLHIYGTDESNSWAELQQNDSSFTGVESQPSDSAYIIYTSGTTGRPKGIVHSHFSGLGYARLTNELYEISSDDYILSHSPLHFDMSTFGYFSGPYAGATSYILPKMFSSFPESLSQLIEEKGFTIWYSIPLILIQLLESGTLLNKDLSKMRWMLYAGEAMPVDQFNQLVEVFDQSTISNVYGPAEVNQCTYFNSTEKIDAVSVPLGYTWTDTEALILDDHDQIINDDQIGELLIHSVTMMKGYFNNEQLNEKAFFEQNGKQFYRTGDLVQLKADGMYHFFGRKDRQVKIKGSRLELNSVDDTLLQFSKVEQAVSFVVYNNEQKELHSVFQAKESIDIKKLYKFIADKLPKYAIPTSINQINEIPRTSAGKINFNQLKVNYKK